MKFFLNITLIIVVIIQLSWAEDPLKVIKPPEGELGEFYNFIANEMFDYNLSEVIILSEIFTDFLEQYNNYMTDHNSKPYQDYKNAIEHFIKSVNEIGVNVYNCNVRRPPITAYRSVLKAKPIDSEIEKMLNKAYEHERFRRLYKILINQFNNGFPEHIESFVNDLSEKQKKIKNLNGTQTLAPGDLNVTEFEKNIKIYELAQEFLKASEQQEKIKKFQNFIGNINFIENYENQTTTNCRFDEYVFKQFLRNVPYIFVDIETLDFQAIVDLNLKCCA